MKTELQGALEDVKSVVIEGFPIGYQRNNIEDIVKDGKGSITARKGPIKDVHSFPIQPNPTEKQLHEAGIRQKVDVLFHLSTLEMREQGLEFRNMETIQDAVIFDGELYAIAEKARVSQFADDFLYITLGCMK
jgi:hypothetical protein